MVKMVRARWMDAESDLVLEDGQLHVQPRHVYEVPEDVVKRSPEQWKVQEDQEREAPEPERTVHTQDKAAPRERAVDTAPREEG